MSEEAEDIGHLPPPSKVEAMAGFGLSVNEIARVFGINEQVLKSSFAEQLDCGAIKANARVAESLYRKALGDGRESVTAAIFWLKTRARWKETMVSEVTHSADNSIAALLQRVAEHGRRIHDHD